MYTYEELRHVHVELTTRCNAQCPMCARNVCGATAPNLELTELTAAEVEAIVPDDLVARLDGFDVCGAYGDPAVARDLDEIVGRVRRLNPTCAITVYTNGGARSPRWWAHLARRLGGPGSPSLVVFAIDGLGPTNAIYRRGVDFDKVIDNARAFIGAGGTARWEFLAFRHNEHEVEPARALSAELGFREFSVKKTARFLEPTYDYVPEVERSNDTSSFPIHDASGAVVGTLEPPSDPALVNETALHYAQLVARHGSLDALFSRTPIHCRVLDTASVFVSAQGHAFPCCWTYVQATRSTFAGYAGNGDQQVVDLVRETGGFDAIDARRVGLRAAVESPLFAAVEASWSCSSVAAGRLRVCARACGTEFPAYFDQVDDPDLLPRGLQPQSLG